MDRSDPDTIIAEVTVEIEELSSICTDEPDPSIAVNLAVSTCIVRYGSTKYGSVACGDTLYNVQHSSLLFTGLMNLRGEMIVTIFYAALNCSGFRDVCPRFNLL